MKQSSSLLSQSAWAICLCAGLLGCGAATAEQLVSGDTRVVLEIEGDRLLCRWGLAAGKLLAAGEPVAGQVDGAPFDSTDLKVVEVTPSGAGTDTPTIAALLRHRELPLEFRLKLQAQGETGVIVTSLECLNKGDRPVELAGLNSLACRVAPGRIGTLDMVDRVEWNFRQRELASEPVGYGNRNDGRSSGRTAPWWALTMLEPGLTMVADLAYSGNWRAEFTPDESHIDCRFGMVFDDDKPLRLAPGASFRLPSAAVAIGPGDDLDGPANAHHRYQRKFVFRPRPEGVPLLVQFNTWYAYGQDIDEQQLLKIIPVAAKIGCEVFVIDAGWYGDGAASGSFWKLRSGDWRVDRDKFPSGLAPIIKAVHDHGMKFGIWVEPELIAPTTETFLRNPGWCLSNDGIPVISDGRAHLDFSIPAVRDHMTRVIEKLAESGTIDWVKLDYNISIGGSFQSARDDVFHTRLHDHLAGYNVWLESLRKAYPHMIVENCSSGARRWDTGILSQSHSSWISDTVNPRRGPQLMWGSLLHSAPEMCNHWMIGDVPENRTASTGARLTSKSPDWWEFMHVAAMGGQYGVSARLDEWPKPALEHATQIIERYKASRHLIDGADVYHLTPQPAPGPKPAGWMAVEFLQPERDRGLVLAFRLDRGPASEVVKLKGLLGDKRYRVTIPGESPQEATGKSLATDGLSLTASSPWQAFWITLESID